MSVMSGLLVCILISLAFIDAFTKLELARVVAALFILAMVALIASLTIFMREIFLSVNSPRAPVI
jgi:ribose/xylose/arabinose/galactoside ABC-type transport system permease subunit